MKNIRQLVIRPTLKHLDLWSPEAEDLVWGTAAHESHFKHLQQVSGPALGLWQIEPATERDLWANYFPRKIMLVSRLRELMTEQETTAQLVGNLFYSAAICRIIYFRHSDPLPTSDVRAYAAYWKKIYNTSAGRGTPEEFARHYKYHEQEV